jgi:hypothetical protein
MMENLMIAGEMDKMENMQTLKKPVRETKKSQPPPVHACKKERKNQSPDPCGAEEARMDKTHPANPPFSSCSSSSSSLSQG